MCAEGGDKLYLRHPSILIYKFAAHMVLLSRKNLDIWPTFPIIIEYTAPHWQIIRNLDEDNIIAALEHPDRVRAIRLSLTGPQLGRIATALAIQEQFPVLTHLILLCGDQDSPGHSRWILGKICRMSTKNRI
jgi:hypothetical protein